MYNQNDGQPPQAQPQLGPAQGQQPQGGGGPSPLLMQLLQRHMHSGGGHQPQGGAPMGGGFTGGLPGRSPMQGGGPPQDPRFQNLGKMPMPPIPSGPAGGVPTPGSTGGILGASVGMPVGAPPPSGPPMGPPGMETSTGQLPVGAPPPGLPPQVPQGQPAPPMGGGFIGQLGQHWGQSRGPGVTGGNTNNLLW